MVSISIIAAMAQDRVIGYRNTLPWRVPQDLKRFKALTMGHRIVMGRKTFESIGKPLPGRENFIVSRQPKPVTASSECHFVSSLLESFSAPFASGIEQKTLFVIGGEQLYRETLTYFAPQVTHLYLTEIKEQFSGDAFFPEFSCPPWVEVSREPQQQTEPTPMRFDFVTYQKAGQNNAQNLPPTSTLVNTAAP